MLGTNDLKITFLRPAEEIATALGKLVDDVRAYSTTQTGKPPKIILISPIEINDQAPRFTEFYTDYYDTHSMVESKKLPEGIRHVADQKGALFLDAATVSRPGKDGIHLDQKSQQPLAELINDMIRSIG